MRPQWIPLEASRLPWLETCSSWDSFCLSWAAWPPAVPGPLSGKGNCFQLSPLTQTFKSKHSKATDHVRINNIGLRKASPHETKGVFKNCTGLPRQAAKPQQFQRPVCSIELGGCGHRPLKRKCHPWDRQAASSCLSPESTREKQTAVTGKGEHS